MEGLVVGRHFFEVALILLGGEARLVSQELGELHAARQAFRRLRVPAGPWRATPLPHTGADDGDDPTGPEGLGDHAIGRRDLDLPGCPLVFETTLDEGAQIVSQPVAELLWRLVLAVAARQRAVRRTETAEEFVHAVELLILGRAIRVVGADSDLRHPAVDEDVGLGPSGERVLVLPFGSGEITATVRFLVSLRQRRSQPRPEDDNYHIALGRLGETPIDRLLGREGRRHGRRGVRIIPEHRLAGHLPPQQGVLRQLLLDDLLGKGTLVGDIPRRRKEESEMHPSVPRLGFLSLHLGNR
jgi:hypothetical protein